MLHVSCVRFLPSGKRSKMVCGVDDGPKTDWLVADPEK